MVHEKCQEKKACDKWISNNNNTINNEKNDTRKGYIQHINAKSRVSLRREWKSKVMHVKYNKNRDRQLFSEEDKFLWLWRQDLKVEIETEITTPQDQTLKQNIMQKTITNTNR